jgi:hypothetical protein
LDQPGLRVVVVAMVLAVASAPVGVVVAADWAFTSTSTREIQLPAAVVDSPEFGELEYDGPPYRGLRADLNGDGAAEYLVESARSLCGNGGCVYALFDGASLRPLGLVFGGWLVVRSAPTGTFSVITSLSHLSAGAATDATFVYDGKQYVQGSSIEVHGSALDRLVQELRQVPIR